MAPKDFLNIGLSQMEKLPRPTLFDFHGVSMTKYFTDNWDDIQNFQARPDDILVATYPKAGGFRLKVARPVSLSRSRVNILPSGRSSLTNSSFFHSRNHLGLLHPGSAVLWEHESGAPDNCSSLSESAVSGDTSSDRFWRLCRSNSSHCCEGFSNISLGETMALLASSLHRFSIRM